MAGKEHHDHASVVSLFFVLCFFVLCEQILRIGTVLINEFLEEFTTRSIRKISGVIPLRFKFQKIRSTANQTPFFLCPSPFLPGLFNAIVKLGHKRSDFESLS